jgi:methyl-accepting chemotaxis protein
MCWSEGFVKGFAVVAGEVGNLAQRRAAAAKEIKSLVYASADKIEVGAEVAAAPGRIWTR